MPRLQNELLFANRNNCCFLMFVEFSFGCLKWFLAPKNKGIQKNHHHPTAPHKQLDQQPTTPKSQGRILHTKSLIGSELCSWAAWWRPSCRKIARRPSKAGFHINWGPCFRTLPHGEANTSWSKCEARVCLFKNGLTWLGATLWGCHLCVFCCLLNSIH